MHVQGRRGVQAKDRGRGGEGGRKEGERDLVVLGIDRGMDTPLLLTLALSICLWALEHMFLLVFMLVVTQTRSLVAAVAARFQPEIIHLLRVAFVVGNIRDIAR